MPIKALFFLSIFFFFAFGALYDPIYGVCGYLFNYYAYSQNVWWAESLQQYDLRLSFIMAIFLAIAMIIQKRKVNYSILPDTKLEVSFYFFIGIICLSLILGSFPPYTNSYYLFNKMLKMLIFLFLLVRAVNTTKKYDMVVSVILITGIYLGVQAFLSPPSRFIQGRLDTLGGVDFTGANEFGTHLSIVLCFIGVAFVKSKKWLLKIFYIIGLVFVINGIILTRSRSVLITMFAATLCAIIYVPKQWRRRLSICFFIGIIFFFVLVDPAFFSRMETMKDSETLSEERGVLWESAFQMIKDYPFGVGVGNFPRIIGHYNPTIRAKDAHNTFILCWCELGIQGFALFILIIFFIFAQLRRVKEIIHNTPIESRVNLEIFTLSLAIIIYIIGGLLHSRLYIEGMWVLFSLPICLEKVALTEIGLIDTTISKSCSIEGNESFLC